MTRSPEFYPWFLWFAGKFPGWEFPTQKFSDFLFLWMAERFLCWCSPRGNSPNFNPCEWQEIPRLGIPYLEIPNFCLIFVNDRRISRLEITHQVTLARRNACSTSCKLPVIGYTNQNLSDSTVFIKFSSIEFHENPCSRSRAFKFVQTDWLAELFNWPPQRCKST
jgi:hypothetical protein